MLKMSSFPSMPQAGVKLMILLKGKDASIAEKEKILRYDPGLTTNVLKLANSSYFGIPSKVGSKLNSKNMEYLIEHQQFLLRKMQANAYQKIM